MDIVTLAVYDSSINGTCVPWSVWKYKDREKQKKDREKTETKAGTKTGTKTGKKTGTISNTNQTFFIVTSDEKDHKISDRV